MIKLLNKLDCSRLMAHFKYSTKEAVNTLYSFTAKVAIPEKEGKEHAEQLCKFKAHTDLLSEGDK